MFLAVISPTVVSTGVTTGEIMLDDVMIFPNPTIGLLRAISSTPIQQIKIFNQLGQLLKVQNVNGQKNLSFTIETDGIFFVQIIADKQTVTKKVIVQN